MKKITFLFSLLLVFNLNNSNLLYAQSTTPSLTTASASVVPTITSFSPLSGEIGTTVTITGTHFNTTPANNIVFFGATKATVSAATGTSLTVTVPSGATYAPITVLNTENSLVAYSNANFNPAHSTGNESIASTDFDPKVEFGTGANPTDVVLGDIDGDGKPDILTSNTNSGSFSVLRNTTTGNNASFATKVDFSYATQPYGGYQPYGITLADIDGDGKLDVSLANIGNSSVTIFLNTSTIGVISFDAHADVAILESGNHGASTNHVRFGDIDGDGKLDMAVSNAGLASFSVFRNTSSIGSISFDVKQDFPTSGGSYSLEFSDLDADGKSDIVFVQYYAAIIQVYKNTSTIGNINFAAASSFATTQGTLGVAIGDLDSDGKPDLAVSILNTSVVNILKNTSTPGTINFDTKIDLPIVKPQQSNSVMTGSWGITIGDIDGDGRPDLALATKEISNTVSILRNTTSNGTISFETNIDLPTGLHPRHVSIGDINEDGLGDIISANFMSSPGTVSVILNNPKSSNADLSALTTTAGTLSPTFAASTLEYTTANVSSSTTSITVTPTQSDANATIEVQVNGGGYTTVSTATASGALSLNVGSNTITTIVTAQDASTKTYIVTVKREDPISNNIISGNQTVCSGDAFAPLTGSVAAGGDGSNYTYLWESSTTGVINEFTPASGTNNTNNYSPTGLTQTTWYRRAVTSGTASDTSSNVKIIIKPLITVDQPENIVSVSGTTLPKISFSGTAPGYSWTNSHPGIGLASSGTGSIPSFMATNTNGAPIVATITVTPKDAAYAYITNVSDNTVSVINTATDAVVSTIPVGTRPWNVAVNPNGKVVYVVNISSSSVSVISTATNTVTATIPLKDPRAATVSPDGTTLYVVYDIYQIAIISTATNQVIGNVLLDYGGYPNGIITSPDGSKLYVADTNAMQVVVLETAGYSVLAKIPSRVSPAHLSVTPDGSTVYVTNAQSNSVAAIDTVTNTIVAGIGVGGLYPGPNCMSPDGKILYATGGRSNTVSVINTATNRVIKTISVQAPGGVSVTPDGTKLYVTDQDNSRISVVNTATNTVIDFINVGSYPVSQGGNFISQTQGCPGSSKTFTITVTKNTAPTFTSTAITSVNEGDPYSYSPTTNDVDGDAVNLTASTIPEWLSLVANTGGDVTSLAGSGNSGSAEGNGTSASFSYLSGVAVDASGNIFVADFNNHRIRKITPNGDVTTLAGSGNSGSANGNGTSASFSKPRGIAVDASGNVFVGDYGNNKVRKITPNGDVTTLAGSGIASSIDANGTSASFNGPVGLALDAMGNVFVADQNNHKIRKISTNGDVTSIAGTGITGSTNANGTSASFFNPSGVALDASGNVYVADQNNHKIRKIAANGDVTTLAGSGNAGSTNSNGLSASFSRPHGIAMDVSGNLFVADSDNNKIRKISPTGDVTTIAGSGGVGNVDALGTNASFFYVLGVALDASGNLYVADQGNHKVRKISGSSILLIGDTTGNAGNHPVVLEASDGNGGTVQQNFTVTVVPIPTVTLSVNNTNIDENGGTSTITATLSNDFGKDVTVNLGYSGTAVSGTNYNSTVSTSVTILAGQTTANSIVGITAIDNAAPEVDKTIIIDITSITNGVENGVQQQTVTITEDDTPTIAFASTNSSGLESVSSVNLEVNTSIASGLTVTLEYTITGTATAGMDYTLANGTLTINPGSTGENITIASIVDDLILEADETIIVTLSNPTNAILGTNTVYTYTINNDDTAAVSIADISANEDDGTITVTATLDNAVQGGFTVDVSTADGTATIADSDYTAISSETLTFTGTAGEIQTFTVTPTSDLKVETDETLTISQSNLAATTLGVVITDGATVTILNDDSATLTVNNITRDENADGTTTAFTFTVTLTGTVDAAFSVDYETANITAIAGEDYLAKTGTINFAGTNGETQQLTVTVNGDEFVELDQAFKVALSNLQAGGKPITLPGQAVGTITNDDSATVSFVFNVSANEDTGAQTFTATVDKQVDGGFSVDVSTVDGTATVADSDYTGITSQTLTFVGTAGETQSFTVTPTADTKVEADENLTIIMNNLGATSFTTTEINISSVANYIIQNDDAAVVTIEDVNANEDDGTITVTATLDNAVQGGFTVDVNTADGTATIADSDYTAISLETLTFTGTAGETQTFSIVPTTDLKVEADEILTISQSNLAATTLVVVITDGATVTIENDDTAAVTIADISANEDDGTITVTASLDNAVDGGFTVDVSTIDGTASTADSDYTTIASETLTFTGTQGEIQTFTITPTADTKLEANETITITQSNLSATSLEVLITDGATVTILNDDSASVMIANVSGNEADGAITVTATLDNPVQGGFTVDVSTSDETATLGGGDYDAIVSQTLTFSGTAGETQTFTVTPIDDTTVETDETLTISQSNLSATSLGVDISDGTTVTINNDDATTVTIEDITVVEADGVANVIATLTNPVQGGFVLNITTADGTAVATSDYTSFTDAAGATFIGTAGETQNVAVPITDDMIGEDIEAFTVTLTSVSGTTVGGNITTTDSVIVTIIDDDAPVVSAVSVPADGNYGIGDNLDFTVTFTNAATTTGAPSIPVIIGTTTIQAVLNGAITESLTADFRYTVVESDLDVDGIALGAAINLNGGTIVGITNIPAILDLNNIGNSSGVTVDGIRPTVVVSSTVADPTNAAFEVTFTFSEAVTGFEVTDLSITNGVASDFTPVSATVYTATITPTADGIVTVEVAASIAIDIANNGNAASNQFSVLYDATNPVPTISSTSPNPTNTTFTVAINFTEDVFGFEMADLVVTNGTASDFQILSATEYSALITATVSGPVFVDIPAGVTEDLATNPNDSASFEIEFDNIPPIPPSITHISEYTCSGDVSQTGDNTLEIFGVAETGSTIEVFIEGISVGTTTTLNSGFFTFDYTGTTLADGTYDFTVTATDIASNTSAISAALTITINSLDTDGDGLPDFCDDDDDGNGVDDTDEDCDGDGIIDSQDTDNSACQTTILQIKSYGFSPNGDGVNDGWTIENITAYPNSVVQVFNRSGKLVFKKKGYQNDWDGISNQISNSGNSRLPVGPYLFIIDLGNGSTPTRGWIYINY